MRAPTAGQLARMQAAAVASMWDTCVRLVYSGSQQDDYGRDIAVYTPQSPALVCGFNATAHREVMVDSQVALTDAVVRLPIDTVLSNLDRIRITHRHGVALTDAVDYEILGEPARGPSGLVVLLRLVTDGS